MDGSASGVETKETEAGLMMKGRPVVGGMEANQSVMQKLRAPSRPVPLPSKAAASLHLHSHAAVPAMSNSTQTTTSHHSISNNNSSKLVNAVVSALNSGSLSLPGSSSSSSSHGSAKGPTVRLHRRAAPVVLSAAMAMEVVAVSEPMDAAEAQLVTIEPSSLTSSYKQANEGAKGGSGEAVLSSKENKMETGKMEMEKDKGKEKENVRENEHQQVKRKPNVRVPGEVDEEESEQELKNAKSIFRIAAPPQPNPSVCDRTLLFFLRQLH